MELPYKFFYRFLALLPMKKIIALLFYSCVSLVSVCQISFFDWDYPEDIHHKDWYFIYDLIDDYQLKTCLDIRDIESLDRMVEGFKSAYETRGIYGLPGEYRLPADDSIAILMKTLAEISYIENVIGKFIPNFTIAFKGSGVNFLVDWYYRNRDNIDLDSLSLYVAAQIYLACKLSPFNFLETHLYPALNHFNHPLNDLDPETEKWIRDLDSYTILDNRGIRQRERIDSILEAHPQNVLIKRLIQQAKVAQFTRMYKAGTSFKKKRPVNEVR
ncbi:MAG: hypothetical protein K2I64_00400 [Muribaculaceae bacterium]|nr:hypothetical protein [Muribaculaceae bacterium]